MRGRANEIANDVGSTTPHPWSLSPLRGEGKVAVRFGYSESIVANPAVESCSADGRNGRNGMKCVRL